MKSLTPVYPGSDRTRQAKGKPTSLVLSETRSNWVANRKNVTLRGSRLAYNVALERKYIAALESLVKSMVRQTYRALISLFKSPEASAYFAADADVGSQARILTNALMSKFSQLFARKGKIIAVKMVLGEERQSNTAMQGTLKKISGGVTIKTNTLTAEKKTILRAAVAENVSLIKSIATDYQNQVQGSVMRSITTGNGLQDLIPELQKYEGMTERRAKNIALDQTRKVYNSMNAATMRKVNVSDYIWRHSGGGQTPRQDHIDMDGMRFSVNPPAGDEPDRRAVINKDTGERGIPGQAINCGCTMEPIVEFDDGEIE